MRPRIFLSSTIADLAPVREAIRETIELLDFEPVMSEFGEVGYLPDQTAEDSCYTSLEQCDVLVAVIGRRYGSIGREGKSITQNEVRRAHELEKPVYCLIDRDVAVQLRTLDANPGIQLPNFDNAESLQSFVKEVVTADKSNSIIEYSSVDDARRRIRRQLAELFGSLLRQKNAVVQQSLGELIREVRGLRYNLPPENTEASAALYAAVKFFVDEEDSPGHGAKYQYRRVVSAVSNGLTAAITPLVRAVTFDDFLSQMGVTMSVMTLEERKARKQPGPFTGQLLAQANGPLLGTGSAADLHYVLFPSLDLWIDSRVLHAFRHEHFNLKKVFTTAVRDAVVASAAKNVPKG